MKRIIVLLIIMAVSMCLAGCGFLADEAQAVRAVTNLGFTDAKVESRAVFSCGSGVVARVMPLGSPSRARTRWVRE